MKKEKQKEWEETRSELFDLWRSQSQCIIRFTWQQCDNTICKRAPHTHTRTPSNSRDHDAMTTTGRKKWTTRNWHRPDKRKVVLFAWFQLFRAKLILSFHFFSFLILFSFAFIFCFVTCDMLIQMYICTMYTHSIGHCRRRRRRRQFPQFFFRGSPFSLTVKHTFIERTMHWPHMAVRPHSARNKYWFINRDKWWTVGWRESTAVCPRVWTLFWCARLTLDPLPFSMVSDLLFSYGNDIMHNTLFPLSLRSVCHTETGPCEAWNTFANAPHFSLTLFPRFSFRCTDPNPLAFAAHYKMIK